MRAVFGVQVCLGRKTISHIHVFTSPRVTRKIYASFDILPINTKTPSKRKEFDPAEPEFQLQPS